MSVSNEFYYSDSERKKIVFDCERLKYPNTGLYHYCLQLGRSLQRNINTEKEELVVYTAANNNHLFDERTQFLPQKSIHKLIFPPTKYFNLWHATHQSTDYFPFKSKIPVVLTIHDLNFLHEEKKNNSKRQKYIQQLQAKINKASHIVCISNFVLNDVTKNLNIDSKPISVIYNGCNVHIESLQNLTKPPLILTNKFLFTIGTIVDKKNFHVLPALLVDNDYQLVIGGITQSKSYKQQIIAEATKYKVVHRVFFTESITENDKNWYYQNCEAFVFPSLAEGFGLPVVEAMHYGKPVFLSIKTSLPEIGGKDAFYFENFESKYMQNILKKGLDDYLLNPNKKIEIKNRAALFNWDNAAKEYLNVYKSLY